MLSFTLICISKATISLQNNSCGDFSICVNSCSVIECASKFYRVNNGILNIWAKSYHNDRNICLVLIGHALIEWWVFSFLRCSAFISCNQPLWSPCNFLVIGRLCVYAAIKLSAAFHSCFIHSVRTWMQWECCIFRGSLILNASGGKKGLKNSQITYTWHNFNSQFTSLVS